MAKKRKLNASWIRKKKLNEKNKMKSDAIKLSQTNIPSQTNTPSQLNITTKEHSKAHRMEQDSANFTMATTINNNNNNKRFEFDSANFTMGTTINKRNSTNTLNSVSKMNKVNETPISSFDQMTTRSQSQRKLIFEDPCPFIKEFQSSNLKISIK